MDLLIGADPELFVTNDRGDAVSAHDLIPGTKKKPYPVELGAIQADGTAAEFNIEPASCKTHFRRNIFEVMKQLRGFLPEGYSLDIKASRYYDEKYFNTLPRHAKELGCDPDYCGWAGTENVIGREAEKTPFRTAAGHIHMGWTEGADPFDPVHYQACRTLAREMDVMLGLPSLLMEDASGIARRSLYGKAGSFRPKPYGMEYRVLGNWWLGKPVYTEWVFSQSKMIFDRLVNRERQTNANLSYGQLIDRMAADNKKAVVEYIHSIIVTYPDGPSTRLYKTLPKWMQEVDVTKPEVDVKDWRTLYGAQTKTLYNWNPAAPAAMQRRDF
jgi:hypothetical protein